MPEPVDRMFTAGALNGISNPLTKQIYMEVQDVEGVELSPEELEELLKDLPDILRELKLEYGHLD